MSTTHTAQPSKNTWARGIFVPIVIGPLRGNWWSLSSGGKISRLLLGTYEPEQSALFRRHIRPGDQVLDIGASVGYYTLLSAKLVGTTGRVVSFEPDSINLQFLQSHVSQNQLDQVTILPIALADETGTARFGGGTGTGTARLCQEGQNEVAVKRLDDVADEMNLRPRHLKIDVEGAEFGVLLGGRQLIKECRPTIFLSTHDGIVPGIHGRCCELLAEWGYLLQPITGENVEDASEILCLAK